MWIGDRVIRKTSLSSALSNTQRSIALHLGEAWWRFSKRVSVGRTSTLRFASPPPERLLVAPTDLRVADPFVAEEFYAGRFPLAGRVLETAGESPFAVPAPTADFARNLHSFRWLRHFRAANHELAFANARALTEDWISSHGRRITGIAWEPDVIAGRVMAWLSHSPIIVKGADHGFYRRFLRSLALQLRYLRQVASATPDGDVRLRVRIALCMSTLALPATASQIRAAARNLDHELDRQILPDGSHISRNPQAGLDLLTDLLPLRHTYMNLGQPLPGRLVPTIDRMFPALRFFRHTDGALALFNGATATPVDRLLSVLRYDESGGAPFRQLPHGGYQRLAAGPTVAIVDAGRPPAGRLSASAHAGSLAFELSSGRHRLIVNCGAPTPGNHRYAVAARSTAAHSTITLDNTSSSRLSQSHFLGPILTGGVTSVTATTADGDDGSRGLTAAHDGYLKIFGLYHERTLSLSADGGRLEGRDRLYRPGDRPPRSGDRTVAVARFHIHPKIRLAAESDDGLTLTAPDGARWLFACTDVQPAIEDSIFLAETAAPTRTRQISVTFVVGKQPDIHWFLTRL